MGILYTTVIPALVSSIVGAIVGALVSKLKTAQKDAIEAREMQRLNLTMTCRMAIYDEHFSVDEKLEAYKVYRDFCHENHQTKTFMDELVGDDVDEYLEKHKKG